MSVWLVQGLRDHVARIAEVITMTGLRTTGIALGAVALLLGAMMVVSGHDNLTSSARDDDGYIMFDRTAFDRSSAAILIEEVDVLKGRFAVHADDSGVPGWAIEDLEVRIRGAAPHGEALFFGIGSTSAVDEYLGGVTRDVITDLELNVGAVGDVEYTRHTGTADPPGPPTSSGLWEASVEGTGELTLDWTVRPGTWTAVIMNADASDGISAEMVFGARASNIGQIGWTKIAIGLVALIGGGLALLFGLRGRARASGVDIDQLRPPGAESLRERSTAAN